MNLSGLHFLVYILNLYDAQLHKILFHKYVCKSVISNCYFISFQENGWKMVGQDDEALLLQQFLKFGETKNLVSHLLSNESDTNLDKVARDIRHARDIRDSATSPKDDERNGDFGQSVNPVPLLIPDDNHQTDNRNLSNLPDTGRTNSRMNEFERGNGSGTKNDTDIRDTNNDFSNRTDIKLSPFQNQNFNYNQYFPISQDQMSKNNDPMKPIDTEQLKKFLERNSLFNPLARNGINDLRPDTNHLMNQPNTFNSNPSPNHGLSAASLASNLLAANPSLTSSIFRGGPQLANSLSLLRLPNPLPNISRADQTSSSLSSSSPLTSPLARLQTMQPFDNRSDRSSPSPWHHPEMTKRASPSSVTSTGSIHGPCSPPMANSLYSLNKPINRNDLCIEHISDDEDREMSSALNLSASSPGSTPVSSSLALASQNCNGPPTPKRSWNPMNMGSTFINPVTGKKRV